MAGSIGVRRRGRECALQVLYSLDLNASLTTAQALAHYWRAFQNEAGDGEEKDPAIISFAEDLVNGATDNQTEIDDIIQRASKNWRLDRMARVDRNVLRLGAWELSERRDVPRAVALDEAVEIAKRFGTEESGAFVNGVLDRIADDLGRKDDYRTAEPKGE